MDDRRTQDALDALADLFLTDPDPFEPLNHPRGGDEEPAPAKLEPAPRRGDPRAARFAGPTSSTEARRGAAPAIDAPAVPRSQTAPLIRAWLGNLPGYAAPWLTQFAARRARRGGMTLLLRLEGRALTASLVGVHRSQLASASPSRSRPTLADYDRIAGDLRAEEPGRLLDAAAREPLIRRVMLHHTTPSAGEGDPLATPDHAPASPVVPTSEASIALITGLDDAALGRLGQLLERLPDPADVGASQGSQVELIVAGATAHDAVEALSRLPDDDPAASVDLAETLPRMEPVEQRAVGDWTLADADLERLLERIDALPAWTESRDPSQPIDATDSPEPSIESLGPAIAADRDFAGPGDETLEQKPRDKPSGPLEPPIAREPEDRPEDAPVGEQLDAGELGHAVDRLSHRPPPRPARPGQPTRATRQNGGSTPRRAAGRGPRPTRRLRDALR